MNLKAHYVRFWILIPILLLIPLLHPVDIKLIAYVDQYNIAVWPLVIVTSLFLFMSGGGYYLLRNWNMNERMTKLHEKYVLFGGVLCLVVFMILLIKNGNLSAPPDISELDTFTLDQFLGLSFILGLFIVFMGSMYYVINVVVTAFFTEKDEENTP